MAKHDECFDSVRDRRDSYTDFATLSQHYALSRCRRLKFHFIEPRRTEPPRPRRRAATYSRGGDEILHKIHLTNMRQFQDLSDTIGLSEGEQTRSAESDTKFDSGIFRNHNVSGLSACATERGRGEGRGEERGRGRKKGKNTPFVPSTSVAYLPPSLSPPLPSPPVPVLLRKGKEKGRRGGRRERENRSIWRRCTRGRVDAL